ncbi:RE1 [Symbiodinium sp. CCMP2592]|nr:RE1 [Symbiodinium sp. CCMP2592]
MMVDAGPEAFMLGPQGDEDDDDGMSLEAQNWFSEAQVGELENQARILLEQKAFHHRACANLIKQLPFKHQARHRQALKQDKPNYIILGVYAYGNHYGITKWARNLPQTCKYLWQYIQHWATEPVRGSTLVINNNCEVNLHRDSNNLPNTKNYVIGVTPFQHGELWLEGEPPNHHYKTVVKALPNGQSRSGHLRSVRQRVLAFDARQWHTVQPWQGDRVILGGYMSRGVRELEKEDIQWLQQAGFPCVQGEEGFREQGVQGQGYVVDSTRAKVGTKVEEEIKRKLYLLHAATGHGSTRHMIEALRRRNVDPLVLQLAESFECPICAERKRIQPRQLASLEPLPPKFHTVVMDIGHWRCPRSGEQQNFILAIDEGSRFRNAKILTKGSKQTPNSAACLNYLSEHWIQVFGKPKTLRLDPAGCFRSTAVENFCDRHDIYMDVIPGEAHWQIGIAEQAIQGVKHLMTKLHEHDSELTPEQTLSLAVATFNQRELIRGFSPVQHVLGQSPDITERHIPNLRQQLEEPILNNTTEEFKKEAARRAAAEKALCDWQAQQRVNRAMNSRTRKLCNYRPGDLVYFWRTQESGQHKRSPGTTQGRFLGPARVLATETRQSAEGEARPGHAIWLVRGRNLLKCAPEQLRPASHREELLDSLSQEGSTPWTYTKLAAEIGGNQFEDISQEIPQESEWQRAQDVTQEAPPSRTRVRGKRPMPVAEPTEDLDLEDEPEPSQPSQLRRTSGPTGSNPFEAAATTWWEQIPESAWMAEEASYWTDSAAAVEVAVDLPTTEKEWKRFGQDATAYVAGMIKRRAVEVSERRLSAEDQLKFKAAKAVEVKNFLSAQAFEALPSHLKPSREQAIGMRWLLTWKVQDDGSVKPKARAILLGYQDPSYEHRSTTAPVMTRQTRQLFLQAAANRRWRIQKGDISGAFLQGRTYPDELFCVPCDEILEAMQLPPGTITKLKRACYGLVDAPLEWYKTVAEFMESIGLTRLWSDACAWVWKPEGQVRGMITGHVDDFMFGGADDDKGWQEILRLIKEKFRWGNWDQDCFTQCGVLIETTTEGFALSQPRYLDSLQEITLNSTRKKQKNHETTEREKSQLRALLGGLSWYAQQTGPHIAAEVSLLLSDVCKSTIETINQANLLLYHAKQRKDHKLVVHRCSDQDMQFYAWVDAANQNRRDGGSTQGIFVGAASKEMLKGAIGHVSPIAWHSSRIDRACRSPGSSETQAAVNGEDVLFYIRYEWAEIMGREVNLRDPSRTVATVDGCLVTDSRNVYDKLHTAVLTIQGAEKKANIELLSVKEAQVNTGLVIRWVHSEAQLANALTKKGGREFELYYKMNFTWRIVEDPSMRSARRRRSEGIDTFEQTHLPITSVLLSAKTGFAATLIKAEGLLGVRSLAPKPSAGQLIEKFLTEERSHFGSTTAAPDCESSAADGELDNSKVAQGNTRDMVFQGSFTAPVGIDLSGQVAVVTGPSRGGIGFETALGLAQRGAKVLLAASMCHTEEVFWTGAYSFLVAGEQHEFQDR